MNHKVVYNACYGGFGLSAKALNILRCKCAGCSHPCDEEFTRHCRVLVETVEELEEEADGICANLQIKELPEGVNTYRIENYDGYETVRTPENTDWIIINDETHGGD